MRQRHKHQWVTVQALRATVVILGWPVTEAIQRCDCGKARAVQVHGWWTKAELNA